MVVRIGYLIMGSLIIIISVLIQIWFSNPYPCTVSCCGCSDMWEMLHDTWTNYVLVVGLLIGVYVLAKGFD